MRNEFLTVHIRECLCEYVAIVGSDVIIIITHQHHQHHKQTAQRFVFSSEQTTRQWIIMVTTSAKFTKTGSFKLDTACDGIVTPEERGKKERQKASQAL
jgi:hypothetical protein